MNSAVHKFIPRDTLTTPDRIDGLVHAFILAEGARDGSIYAHHVLAWCENIATEARRDMSLENIEKCEKALDVLTTSFSSLTTLKNTI